MKYVFWICLVAIAYPYAIYPLLLMVFNRLTRRRMPAPVATHTPSVSIIMPVHNEARRVDAKMRNLLELEYPREQLQIIVVGDGCTDDSLERARAGGAGLVEVVPLATRSGKAAGLNAGLARARGEIVVFTDAAIMLDRGALAALVAHFANPEVGCVSGEDYVEGGGGEGVYGRIELLLRREEARLHSIAGASGCFYGQRRTLCRPFVAGMAPDFLSVLETVRAGQRALCEPAARGAMTATSDPRAEFTRKTRTFLRGLTALFGNAALLNPFAWPAFAFILWSHKLLRWLGPLALAGCLAANIALAGEWPYGVLLGLQLAFYALAAGALLAPGSIGRLSLARIAAFFLLVNAAAAKALALWTVGVRQELWGADAETGVSTQPIRVLHLRDSPWVDGPGRTIVETAAHIDPRRVEYHVGVFAPDRGEHALVNALTDRSASVHRLPDRPGIDSGSMDALMALLDRLQIDVLHTSEFRSNVFGLLCRRRRPRRLRLVSTVHGWIANNLRGRLYRFADKLLLRGFDGVIMVSAATRALVPRWWLGDRRVLVLPNALVLGSYARDAVERPRRRFDPADIVLLNVGRLSAEKGQDLLLRALARLAPDYPGLKLRFAGIGPLEGELRELAASLGIAARVSFLGYVTDMPALYGECDLLVQSSLTEGMPNVILEAAYLRMPMVATAVGGTAEVVREGHSARLIRPGSIDEIAAGIRAFLEAPGDFAAMAARGHADVREKFSFTLRTQRLTEFYERLCAGATP